MSLFAAIVTILFIVLLLIGVGIALYHVNQMKNMDRKLKIIINVFVVIAVILLLLSYFNLLQPIKNVRL